MGVRFSRRHVGVGPADDCRRTPLRRQPERHRLLPRRGERLHRCGRSRRRAVCARRFPSARSDRPRRVAHAGYAAYFSDQKGFVYAVDAATGRELWTRKVEEHPLVRLTGAPVLFRGRLYVPTSSYEEGGKPPGYACCTFRGAIVALDARTGEVIWKTYTIAEAPRLLRAYANGTELRGPVGRRDLVGADDRREARRPLRRRRQHLQRRGAADDRRDPGVRSEDRRAALVATDGAVDAGRVRLHAGRGQLRRACRSRLRLRRLAGAGHPAERAAADRRWSKVRSGVRARSRQERRAGVALPRRRRQRSRRHPVGHRGGWRARLRAGRRDLQPEPWRPSRGRSRHRLARVVSPRRRRRCAASRAAPAAARNSPP